jgi:hypothetical protein
MSAFADCDKAIAGYSAHSTFGRSGQIRSQTLVQVRGVPPPLWFYWPGQTVLGAQAINFRENVF